MSRLPARNSDDSMAFCDGVAAEIAGDLVSTNPFLVSDPIKARRWQEGWYASKQPLAWATITAYDEGELATADGKIWVCVVPGTSVTSPELLTPSGVFQPVQYPDPTGPTWMLMAPGALVDLTCCGVTIAAGVPYDAVHYEGQLA